ncbi:Hypothetical predicted protein [Mytilus galloprovincialis]|uniref:BPTI/Kunitz inhibitor domain-containing protein n=1 Tax=Mytilus galloprovincialis TaxID=29158 RepID=A0A8B6FQ36_MYTGA|nr:Hypothetical predicted protein [Mytilus galloprovincialis]
MPPAPAPAPPRTCPQYAPPGPGVCFRPGNTKTISGKQCPGPPEIIPCNKDCLLPKKPGPCRASITRYYYDIKTRKCRPFVYGGCQGNANNYLTREQCQDKCKLQHGNPHKPGKCPAVNLAALTCQAGELPRKCYNDLSCPGIQKCCRRLCEFVCLNPAPVTKPGDCPYVNLALVDCFAGPLPRQCSNDGGCPGKQKCCRRRCAIVCRDPGNPCPPEPVCPSLPVRPDQCEPSCKFEYETLNGITCKIRCTRGPLGPRPRPGQLCPPTGCPLFGPSSKSSPTNSEPPAPAPPPPSTECQPVCSIICLFGNILDENNCPTCECKTESFKINDQAKDRGASDPPSTAPGPVIPCYPWKPLQGINCGLAPNSKNCPAGYMCNTNGDGTHDKAGQCCPACNTGKPLLAVVDCRLQRCPAEYTCTEGPSRGFFICCPERKPCLHCCGPPPCCSFCIDV